MTQFSNEKTFDARLKEIGDLYEEGKRQDVFHYCAI